MGTRKTHEQFVDELSRKNIKVDVLEQYVNSSTPITCRCQICGLEWKARPANLLFGYGCPACGIKKAADSQRKDSQSFVKELEHINPNISVIEKYKGARISILCECKKCGHRWKAAPTNLLKGKGCPICSREIIADKKRFTNEQFIKIVHSFHKDINPIEQYQGSEKKIKMKCDVCGNIWETTASALICGRGCPRCAGNGIYSQEEFMSKLKTINPFIKVIGEYKRSHTPVKCQCLRCGHIWESRPNNLLQGKGCPACFHSSTSFVEQVIFEVFSLILGKNNVKSRNRSAIGKELDIYVPSLNIAIEPGSWRWHFDKIENDNAKREICKEHGIRLITVYSDFNGETPPFDYDCICIKETLGFEGDIRVLKQLVIDLLKTVNLEYEISSLQWDEIIKKAYDKSRRLTSEEFSNKVEGISNNITVLGEYTGAWNKILCQCNDCGYQWSPIANSLLHGHGCPKCAVKKRSEKRRKTSEQFEIELKLVNPKIKLISKYVKSTEKVGCRCVVCGHEWLALPSNLLKGKGCPVCAREIQSNKKK